MGVGCNLGFLRNGARTVPQKSEVAPHAHYSGLEPLTIRPESNFTMVGERTNVTGSRRFARLIKNDDYPTALEVAANQVRVLDWPLLREPSGSRRS